MTHFATDAVGAKHTLIAAIIALACNLGIGRMARSSGISPAALGWTAEWYLSHETLEAATGRIVDHQSRIRAANDHLDSASTGTRPTSQRSRTDA
jgi:Tn3 transposase DDE domain